MIFLLLSFTFQYQNKYWTENIKLGEIIQPHQYISFPFPTDANMISFKVVSNESADSILLTNDNFEKLMKNQPFSYIFEKSAIETFYQYSSPNITYGMTLVIYNVQSEPISSNIYILSLLDRNEVVFFVLSFIFGFLMLLTLILVLILVMGSYSQFDCSCFKFLFKMGYKNYSKVEYYTPIIDDDTIVKNE